MDNTRIPRNQIVDPRHHLRQQLEKERAKRHARSRLWLFWFLVEKWQKTCQDFRRAYQKNGLLGIARQLRAWYEDVHHRGFLGKEAKWLNRHFGNPDNFGLFLLFVAFVIVCLILAFSRLG